jgi:hypothetical protein
LEEIISTRRLVQIVKGFTIFGDKVEAINNCTNRFSGEIQKQFIDLYGKIDATVTVKGVATKVKPDEVTGVEIDANKIPL